MDRDLSTPQELLECPYGHAGHLPCLTEGQLTLLEQVDGQFPPQLLRRHPGDMKDFTWYFDGNRRRHLSTSIFVRLLHHYMASLLLSTYPGVLTVQELSHHPQKVVELIVVNPVPGVSNGHDLSIAERPGP